MEDLNTMIKFILNQKDWEQKRLAKYLNVAPSQVSRWINGKTVPRFDVARKILEKYNELQQVARPA